MSFDLRDYGTGKVSERRLKKWKERIKKKKKKLDKERKSAETMLSEAMEKYKKEQGKD